MSGHGSWPCPWLCVKSRARVRSPQEGPAVQFQQIAWPGQVVIHPQGTLSYVTMPSVLAISALEAQPEDVMLEAGPKWSFQNKWEKRWCHTHFTVRTEGLGALLPSTQSPGKPAASLFSTHLLHCAGGSWWGQGWSQTRAFLPGSIAWESQLSRWCDNAL